MRKAAPGSSAPGPTAAPPSQDVVVPEDADVNGFRLTATYKPLTKLSVTSSLIRPYPDCRWRAVRDALRAAARSRYGRQNQRSLDHRAR